MAAVAIHGDGERRADHQPDMRHKFAICNLQFAICNSVRFAILASVSLVALAATKPAPAAADDPTGKDLAFALQSAFADAIERVEPSLVSVARIRTPDSPVADSLLIEPARRPFDFQRPRRGFAQEMHPSWVRPDGTNWMPQDFGSGVVIDSDGLILTNHHVVERADKLWVFLHDGKVLPGEIWAMDPRSDLAVIRVQATNLKPITMGDAAKVKKGHIVLALGNPFAAARDGRSSASWGIISNIARRLPPSPEGKPEDLTLHHSGTLFQTDARLNYGTSGGALINLNGEMIGLTTALAAVRGYDEAAGYAVPTDAMMRSILAVLREGREVEYGFLGIRPDDVRVNETEATVPGAPKEGARVVDCFIGSPAYQGGLHAGDIITSVDGIPVRNREELVLTVGMRFAGNRVPFAVWRDEAGRGGRRINVNVTLGKFPVAGQIVAKNRPAPWRGIRVDHATVLLREQQKGQDRLNGVPDGGVVVIEVETGSPADNAGVPLGENPPIITHVGTTRVHTPAEFYEAVKKLKGTVELKTDAGNFSVAE